MKINKYSIVNWWSFERHCEYNKNPNSKFHFTPKSIAHYNYQDVKKYVNFGLFNIKK